MLLVTASFVGTSSLTDVTALQTTAAAPNNTPHSWKADVKLVCLREVTL